MEIKVEIRNLMAKANWYYRNLNKSNVLINYFLLYNQLLNTINQLCSLYHYDFSSILNIITTSSALRKDDFVLVNGVDLYGNAIKVFTLKNA